MTDSAKILIQRVDALRAEDVRAIVAGLIVALDAVGGVSPISTATVEMAIAAAEARA